MPEGPSETSLAYAAELENPMTRMSADLPGNEGLAMLITAVAYSVGNGAPDAETVVTNMAHIHRAMIQSAISAFEFKVAGHA